MFARASATVVAGIPQVLIYIKLSLVADFPNA